MRKSLLALTMLFAAGVAHAEQPLFVHGLGLGQSLPAACDAIATGPCVASAVGPVGNLTAYMITGLSPLGSAGETAATVGVDKAGKVRVVLTTLGPAATDLDRARESITMIYGPATVEGDLNAEWDAKDSVLGVTHRSTFESVGYAFDDAYAPAALDLLSRMFPKE